uniref:ABC transporter domain-containing protein n=1 Tax=Meloidogyne incognita TaxID=6306 RepID=A0A914N349_MELIC
MGFGPQLSLLLWKNLIVLWRSKCMFLLELAFLFILLPVVLVVVRYAPKPNIEEQYSFEPFQITGDSLDINRSISHIRSIDNYYNCGRDVDIHLGFSYEPGMDKLAFEIMEALSERYSDNETMRIFIHNFTRLETMMEVLKEDLNDTREYMCSEYIGGVHFQSIRIQKGKSQPQLVYRILMPQKTNIRTQSHDFDLSLFWLDNSPGSVQADHNQIPGSPPYWQRGFLSIQFAIESTFIEMNKGPDFMKDKDFYLLRVPIDKSSTGGIDLFLKAVLVLWLLSISGIMLHTSKEIVIDKEAGIKTYMSVMGLHPLAFYLSHIIFGIIKSTAVMVICTALLSIRVQYSSSLLFIILTVLFAVSMVFMAALFSAIFKTTQLAQLFCMVIPILFLILNHQLAPAITNVWLCFLFSLNPITAFSYGLAHIINAEKNMIYLGWFSIFDNGTTQFTIAYSLFMLVVDSAILCFLIFYIDSVFPTDGSAKKHPLFLFENFWKRHSHQRLNKMPPVDQTDSKILIENMEPENASIDEADIIIQNLSKRFGYWGNLAVDNLNFRAYRGQVTVLLGHNGAGKTTTFSMITGSITSSGGYVIICGRNLEDNLDDCRKVIGYCPQHNPLFEKVTVREHLQLYAGLKTSTLNGPHGRNILNEEIADILESINLSASLDIQSQNLSGGQKRKLCVAISLVAGSQVVLLDEPTAGMDPIARKEISTLLTKIKKDRTILLTTHYMDEADKLGDRVGIMVNGRLMCNGSPDFLKKKFGTGFILTILCNSEPQFFFKNIEEILTTIQKHSPDAYVYRSNRFPQFSIILPISDKRQFADLFDELQFEKERLCIDSFGLSLNTLEQVFLRVGELAEPEEHKGFSEDVADGNVTETPAQKLASTLFGVRQQQFVNTNFSKVKLWLRQIFALLWRQYLWTIRNPLRSLLPIAIALLLFYLIKPSSSPKNSTDNKHRSLSLDDANEQFRIPIQIADPKLHKVFTDLSESVCSNCFFNIDPKKDLHSELKNYVHQMPPMVAGVAIYENKSSGHLQLEAIFNGLAIHSPPSAISFISNGLLGSKSSSIRLTIEVYDVPRTLPEDFAAIFTQIALSIGIILCFSIFSASMLVPLVEERSIKFKHQLMLTKLHVVTYWISVFIWNAIFYTFYCSFLLLFFLYFGWMEGHFGSLIQLWAAYLWCYVAQIAFVSFLFDKWQRAFTALFSWGTITSIFFRVLTIILTSMLHFADAKHLIDPLNQFCYIINPIYAFSMGIVKISLSTVLFSNGWLLKEEMLTLLISGCVFWILVVIVQSRTISTKINNIYSNLNNKDPLRNSKSEDIDVQTERSRLVSTNDIEFVLAVRDLTKLYGNFPALQKLTFGISGNECFGLLGVNGAGKTTTFDILTGVRFATSGSATVDGVNVNAGPAIGYCPQFDAIPLELTGRQVLKLVARLNGLSDVSTRIRQILHAIRLEEHVDKLIKNYSGGQRRRISIGLALLTRSSLIMLDEPTAGIDPSTRRQIWNLLQAIRQQGIAILLTSHSMEECEELCSRIAFLNKGLMIGIGSSQHLKSRFGGSFLLAITISNPSEEITQKLNQIVGEEFENAKNVGRSICIQYTSLGNSKI